MENTKIQISVMLRPFVNIGIGISALELEFELELTLKCHYLHFHQAYILYNLAGWWLWMREPHPQNHVTHRYRGRVTNENVISSFSQDPWSLNVAGL